MPKATLRVRPAPWLVAGIVTWVAFVARFTFSPPMSLIDVILVFGPLVVVPLARPLVAEIWFPPEAVQYAAALSFAFAFVNRAVGRGGTALAVPWLLFAATILVRHTLHLIAAGSRALLDIARLAACGFLVVGAFFAVATRAGWIVVGISEPIVELTSVHFHFAGFATLVLATCVARALPHRARVTNPMLILAGAAPPAVAAGFTWELAPLQIGGAIMITLATWSLAAIAVAFVVRDATGISRTFLVISSASVVAPMVLAVFWATAQYYDVPALSIPAMARVHGTLNAFGFVTCGLIGWRLHSARDTARVAALTDGGLVRRGT